MTNDFQMPRDIHTIIPSQYRGYEFEKDKAIFEIKMSDYVKRLRSQYLLIERELIKTFEYVEPSTENYETNSIRFASIIRESCNLFELVCKEIYYKLFEHKKRINIIDFLELDKYLYFKDTVLSSPYLLASDNGQSSDIVPFRELKDWNREDKIEDKFIPKWWSTYNKIKHNQQGIRVATLENALLAISGLYELINSIYGEGVLIGELRDYYKKDVFGSIHSIHRVEQSQLFTYQTFGSNRMA